MNLHAGNFCLPYAGSGVHRGKGDRGLAAKSNLNPPTSTSTTTPKPLAALHGRARSQQGKTGSGIKRNLNNRATLHRPPLARRPCSLAHLVGRCHHRLRWQPKKLFEVYTLGRGAERERGAEARVKFGNDAGKLFLFIRAFNNKL